MNRLNFLALGKVRALARQSANAEIARDVGAIVLGESVEVAERDWCARYMTYFFNAFAFHSAIELSCGDHNLAREIVESSEVQNEIASRIKLTCADVAGARS